MKKAGTRFRVRPWLKGAERHSSRSSEAYSSRCPVLVRRLERCGGPRGACARTVTRSSSRRIELPRTCAVPGLPSAVSTSDHLPEYLPSSGPVPKEQRRDTPLALGARPWKTSCRTGPVLQPYGVREGPRFARTAFLEALCLGFPPTLWEGGRETERAPPDGKTGPIEVVRVSCRRGVRGDSAVGRSVASLRRARGLLERQGREVRSRAGGAA